MKFKQFMEEWGSGIGVFVIAGFLLFTGVTTVHAINEVHNAVASLGSITQSNHVFTCNAVRQSNTGLLQFLQRQIALGKNAHSPASQAFMQDLTTTFKNAYTKCLTGGN